MQCQLLFFKGDENEGKFPSWGNLPICEAEMRLNVSKKRTKPYVKNIYIFASFPNILEQQNDFGESSNFCGVFLPHSWTCYIKVWVSSYLSCHCVVSLCLLTVSIHRVFSPCLFTVSFNRVF